MSEEDEKKEEHGFKITDKRFSSKISQQESQEKRDSGDEKGRAYEKEQGEQRKKSLKERLFGKSKTEQNEQTSIKSEESNNHFTETEIDFSSFILSLGTQVLMHLGEIPNPITNKKEKELSLAKQTIDLIGMLKEKTKGNLTVNEEQLIENLLYDLRMKYVEEA